MCGLSRRQLWRRQPQQVVVKVAKPMVRILFLLFSSNSVGKFCSSEIFSMFLSFQALSIFLCCQNFFRKTTIVLRRPIKLIPKMILMLKVRQMRAADRLTPRRSQLLLTNAPPNHPKRFLSALMYWLY
jgi:hypothetical protein